MEKAAKSMKILLKVYTSLICIVAWNSFAEPLELSDEPVVIPNIQAIAVDGDTGVPSKIEIDGEQWTTMISRGKVVGFSKDGEIFKVAYLRTQGGVASHWVIMDSTGFPIGLPTVTRAQSVDMSFHQRYLNEDSRSFESLRQLMSDREKQLLILAQKQVDASKPKVVNQYLPNDVRSRKNMCQIYCDAQRDYAINKCEYGFGIGSAVCDLTASSVIGSIAALSCRTKTSRETKICENGASSNWTDCTTKCNPGSVVIPSSR
jgi:hypothetical protein